MQSVGKTRQHPSLGARSLFKLILTTCVTGLNTSGSNVKRWRGHKANLGPKGIRQAQLGMVTFMNFSKFQFVTSFGNYWALHLQKSGITVVLSSSRLYTCLPSQNWKWKFFWPLFRCFCCFFKRIVCHFCCLFIFTATRRLYTTITTHYYKLITTSFTLFLEFMVQKTLIDLMYMKL